MNPTAPEPTKMGWWPRVVYTGGKWPWRLMKESGSWIRNRSGPMKFQSEIAAWEAAKEYRETGRITRGGSMARHRRVE